MPSPTGIAHAMGKERAMEAGANEAVIALQNYAAEGRDAMFSTMLPEHEKLQPVPGDAHYEWTETSMFGFNIPEHGIDCIIYYWHHPTQRTVFGGITIWRGLNDNQIETAYSDYRLAMPMPDDITDCTYANGVTIRMIRPCEEFAISFDDPAQNTHLRLHLSAIMPAACRYNGGHITQAMRTKGELILRGERFAIDGFHTRDRSWGEARSEAHRDIPPVNWTVGIFGEDLAFHHLSFDNRRHRPEWGERFAAHGDTNNMIWGYVWDGGEIHGVRAVDQKTDYAANPFRPERVQSVISASNGRDYVITGQRIASTQVQCWPNMSGNFALMEWQHEGRIGHGDIQMCTWAEAYTFYRRLLER